MIRHGTVDYDSHPGRFRGHGIDLLPLSPQGVADAEALTGVSGTEPCGVVRYDLP